MARAATWHHAAMIEPPAFTVRRATPADIPALVELRIAFDHELAGPLPAERADEHRASIESYLRSHVPDGRYRMWVADAAGEVVGMAAPALAARARGDGLQRDDGSRVAQAWRRPGRDGGGDRRWPGARVPAPRAPGER
jgi:hypothetical protein